MDSPPPPTSLSPDYLAGFKAAQTAAHEMCDYARGEGECDMRQLRHWIDSIKPGQTHEEWVAEREGGD